MDLIGDIIEHDTSDAAPVSKLEIKPLPVVGFPQPKKISSFKSKIKKSPTEQNPKIETKKYEGLERLSDAEKKLNYDNMSESEKIHLENIEILNNLSMEEKMAKKDELINSMDPKVLMKLLMRSEQKLVNRRDGVDDREKEEGVNRLKNGDFQGYNEWIGGFRNDWKENTFEDDAINDALRANIKSSIDQDFKGTIQNEDVSNPNSKNARFYEHQDLGYQTTNEDKTQAPIVQHRDYELDQNLDEIAPPSYQINQQADLQPFEETIQNVHFLKPSSEFEQLDPNDENFNVKLHEKYFPDLPRDTEKLKWMEPLPKITPDDLIINDVSELRFNFNGDLMISTENSSVDTSMGLHHHSEKPSLPGYTLKELSHLSRSKFPGQRCIAIQTLGRILHKLGKGKYNIIPEFIDDNNEIVVEENDEIIEKGKVRFNQMFWGIIDELKIIDTLTEFSNDNNLSVKNYSTEALWLWKQGGGNKRYAN
ncbi:hypothetical protein WICMUC_001146 [Wickerhamomyces mucosus]|uniref:RNA polymerase II-associated protein RBA50 n=1 Tax=Wickerhamomyces mucosus TaxID=1378264 RepID=A0A9P8PVK7_9ASCO|nr:hypothetical protein WICMUC_001146 [Wickerhamomyces mucosus]